MPAKTPIYLKANGRKTGNGNGKKLRELLSTDMISPPLSDFRHMAHVGRGGAGDMFGDTSFLQQKIASKTSTQNDSVPKVVAEGLATMRRNGSIGSKKSLKKRNLSTPDEQSMKADAKSLTTPSSHEGYGPAQSPILQSAFSLPLLSQQSTSMPSSPTSTASSPTSTPSSPKMKKGKKSKGKKTMNNNSISNAKASSHDTGLDQVPIITTPTASNGGPPKPRRIVDDSERLGNGNHVVGNGVPADNHTTQYPDAPDGRIPVDLISDTTSIDEGWALDLDLGSSLMDDVIGVMDKIEL